MLTTIENAVAREAPMPRNRAGAILSKKRARDMTHTFELEPCGEQGHISMHC